MQQKYGLNACICGEASSALFVGQMAASAPSAGSTLTLRLGPEHKRLAIYSLSMTRLHSSHTVHLYICTRIYQLFRMFCSVLQIPGQNEKVSL